MNDNRTLQHFNISSIPIEYVKQMRVYAIMDEKTTSEIVVEALKMYIESRQKASRQKA